MAADSQNISLDTRQRAVKTISRHIEDALELQREFHGRHRQYRPITEVVHLWRKLMCGTYVTTLYLLVKLLYLANVTGQFFLLSSFLSPRYRFWGAEILIDLANGREWMDSGHFPRVTMCDFEVRVLGNLHRYTIQCVLMINMFNEKIFLFLWWWFLFVAIANVVNLLYWFVICLTYAQRVDFVERYLRVSELLDQKPEVLDAVQIPQPMDDRTIRKFVVSYLRFDGVFMLRMLSTHAGELVTTEIVSSLWRSFCNRYIALPYAVERTALQFGVNKPPPIHRPSYGQNPSAKHAPLLEYPKPDRITARQADTPVGDSAENTPSTDPGFIEAYHKDDPNRGLSAADQGVE